MEMCKSVGNRINRFFDDWTGELEYGDSEMSKWRKRAHLKGKRLPARIQLVRINITKTKEDDLLQDPRVIDEIARYRWIESEMNGCDIGFEKASREWLDRYSKAWREFHSSPRSSLRQAVIGMREDLGEA